jgi:hypothetical protein
MAHESIDGPETDLGILGTRQTDEIVKAPEQV